MKKRHRREDMERLLSERRAEGLTFRELSERSGIPIPTLSYWAVKLRREQASDEPRLVPVEVIEDGGSAPLAIEVSSGLRVLVGRDFDTDHLSRVLSVLTARC
jgi:predicted transcriptional regulator